MTMKTILAASLAAAALTGLASAQDYSLPPTFGSVSLNPGFLPDPHQAQLVAGGTIDASSLGSNCVGMIANAPDYRLQYGEGGSQLFIGVTSSADTTLVVNGPDGSWYCNDDTDGLNPLVGGAGPMAGQYDIWVGTYGSDTAQATLFITEYDQ
ncbi:peptidase S1 [Maricaulis sp.]|uniref:peptidase S1 n=1 Tax=Maricaulis sp. TaxID=1486257 RepID=UPI003A8F1451